jgi:hypothetical protein
MILESSIQRAGDVLIESLKLLSTKNTVTDLDEFLIELNIYEDIFSNFIRGELALSDSRNLIQKLPIIGEEYLLVKLRTPTFDSVIQKTFRIVQITDRKIVRDNNTQTFILHFVSQELIANILLPLYRSFEGNIDDVVLQIFNDYLMMNRNYEITNDDTNLKEIEIVTPLKILTETENKVKFVSPGWSPFKCINWLASKSIPKQGKACNFLFFETNKAFYYTSIENIFDFTNTNKSFIGNYTISASNIKDNNRETLNREYFLTEDVDMISTTDHIKNYTNGYLANRLITLDVFNKIYDLVDYDHTIEYKNYKHTSGDKAIPIFAENSLRNPSSSVNFYPINPKLFNNFEGNINEKIKNIYGNRKSTLLELTNLRLNINIPGRTDIEVGSMLRFNYPELGPRDISNTNFEDIQYSGFYIITAIKHKIVRLQTVEHRMIMEIVKDSLFIGSN